jgi:hypothetical protein
MRPVLVAALCARTGNVLRSTSHFYDEKGDVRSAETSCTKQ